MSTLTVSPSARLESCDPFTDPSLTFPQRLVARSLREANEPAMFHKRLGCYKAWSWAQYRDEVLRVMFWLSGSGFRKGDRLCFMADSRPEIVIAALAAQGLGGIEAGIYATTATAEVAYYLRDTGARFVVCETQEHLDKVLYCLQDDSELAEQVVAVVLVDARTMFMYESDDTVVSYDAIVATPLDETSQAAMLETIMQGEPDDPALIIYTSGTTGDPKGVLHTHRTWFYSAASWVVVSPSLAVRRHRVVAHLSLAHGVGRALGMLVPLVSRLTPYFCEDNERFAATLKEVAPNYILWVPRYWQKFAAQMVVNIESASRLKRIAYRRSMAVARRVQMARSSGKQPSLAARLAYSCARKFVFGPLLDSVGLSRLTLAYTGSASMPPTVMTIWQCWGVDLKEVYGQTEGGGLALVESESWRPAGTLGKVVPPCEARLVDGVLQLRSPAQMVGIWNRSDAEFAQEFDDGWVITGDSIEQVGDRFVMIDREKHFFNTSGGKRLSPQQIENAIKSSPYVSEAIAIGEQRKYVSALIEIDVEAVSFWAQSNGVAYSSFADLVGTDQVQELLSAEVARANQSLQRPAQVKKFKILPFELDPEHGDTTATRKVKRFQVAQQFHDEIEGMYDDAEVAQLERELQ